ncbi:10758_t:CDS:2 [Paraglomus brasilianum]|uniref:10758_t:CDS:1 n=1 Tax=Paraglomus brasilianum TaxID=144538 RepID=A0A9N9BF81_9GLOM|nr:10758_t:CDS:2 [Paraglomus brasilianum]
MIREYNRDDYDIIETIGEGTFSVVFLAKDANTGDNVAIKAPNGILGQQRIRREIKILSSINHENVINLLAFKESSAIAYRLRLILPYCPFTIKRLLKDYELTTLHTKASMVMILRGVAYLHEQGIIHRDLSPNNILVDRSGIIKIADLGCAWTEEDDKGNEEGAEKRGKKNHEVGTRAPEILFSSPDYTESIDIWSTACIIAEFFTQPPGTPLFCGESDIDQICRIFRVLNVPDDSTWPEFKYLPDYGKITFEIGHSEGLSGQDLPNATDDVLNFIKQLLVLRPIERLPARQALQSPYLSEFSAVSAINISELKRRIPESLCRLFFG